MRIAIMMLVHKNENQVNRLINHLSKNFDIYVHIDKKTSIKINKINNVYVYKEYKTYWGSFNQIMATLFLLKKGYERHYDRYILISGQDLPIKTNEEIINFFDDNNYEYIELEKLPTKFWAGNGGLDRLTKYHIMNGGIKKYQILSRLLRKIFHTNISVGNYFLNIITGKIKERKIDYNFYGGANWSNYTHNCVDKIFKYLENDKNYIKRYRWTHCADEIFYQTIIAGIENLNIENNCLRYVDWESGPEYPRILRDEDYEKIIKTKALFGRKFDENIDKNIIEKIYKKIGEK